MTILVITVLVQLLLVLSPSSGCSIDVRNDLPKNEPIIALVGNGSSALALPNEHGFIQLVVGQELILGCPGRFNRFINVPGTPSSVHATCDSSKMLMINRRLFPVGQLNCQRQCTGEIKSTGEGCGGDNAEIFQLGYYIQREWYYLISVCHIKNKSTSLYASHDITWKSLKGSVKETGRPGFIVGKPGFYPGFSPDNVYKKVNEKKIIEGILQNKTSVDYYFNSTYIARGHLAPCADFVLPSYQHLSFFYVNTAPEWQAVNAGNWLQLEKAIRSLAVLEYLDLHVITGTHGVLQLPDGNSNVREIYMSVHQLPVPKFFWKIIYDVQNQKGISFVTINNPFIGTESHNDMLCNSICDKSGWMSKSHVWNKFENGYTYCCDIHSLRRVIPHIPDLKVTGIIQGPYAV